jgi:hypothetical protein
MTKDWANHRDIRKKLKEIRGEKLPEILSDFFRNSHSDYVGLSGLDEIFDILGEEECVKFLGKVLCKQQLINKTLITLMMDFMNIIEEENECRK